TGLQISGGFSTVKALAIVDFDFYGIKLSGNNNVVVSCYLGITSAGDAAGNGLDGIVIFGSGNTVGSAIAIGSANGLGGNVISGNIGHGVGIQGFGATNNVVMGNLIGLNPAGTAALGNLNGVFIVQASNNRIGTDGDGVNDAAERNV